jgi:2-polyprenyl-3-methyl-5-hydroxy-6-metoxy-1,4-benzoquinol methylase
MTDVHAIARITGMDVAPSCRNTRSDYAHRTRGLKAAMTELALTDRQHRERAYYDEYARRTAPDRVWFEPVSGAERRPWNPYWFVAGLVRDAYTRRGQRLLDFGCGPGLYSVQFAHIGYEVFGFDISPANVQVAQQLSVQYGVQDRMHFQQGVAERLEYPDAYFDVIAGIDILHHVEIEPAIVECLRVLKPGGIAAFKEPVEAPLFDRLRNTRMGRWLAPKQASFELHITEDERKLTRSDLDTIMKAAPGAEVHPFRVLSRVEALFGDRAPRWRGSSLLEMLDPPLVRVVPGLHRLAGTVVIVFRRGPSKLES